MMNVYNTICKIQEKKYWEEKIKSKSNQASRSIVYRKASNIEEHINDTRGMQSVDPSMQGTLQDRHSIYWTDILKGGRRD